MADICKQVCILDTMYGKAIISKTHVECSDFEFDSISIIRPSRYYIVDQINKSVVHNSQF